MPRFPRKAINSSGQAALGPPLQSPLSKTGSVHSSRDGSRMWSVSRDLRRTRNAITIRKTIFVPIVQVPVLVWRCFYPATGPPDRKQWDPIVLISLKMCFKVQWKAFLFFFFGKKKCRRRLHLWFLAFPSLPFIELVSESCDYLAVTALESLSSFPSLSNAIVWVTKIACLFA